MDTDPGLDNLLADAETRVRVSPATPEPAPFADPESVGRYVVRGVLGEGAMSRVYRAFDPVAKREVAVKMLRPPFAADALAVERFRREASVVRQLFHPSLVAVLDVGPNYIVQEAVEGENLALRLRRQRTLAPCEALAVLAPVAEALDHVHAHGVVHRDVKPSNVLLALSGQVKLTDFGVARLGWAPITGSGEVIGSPAYMAPEQVSRGQAHAKSDLYALGVVAYEVLTGRRPFRRSSLSRLLQSIVRDAPASASAGNPALPSAVDAVLAVALAKAPEARYRSGREFVAALAAALAPSRPGTWALSELQRDLEEGR